MLKSDYTFSYMNLPHDDVSFPTLRDRISYLTNIWREKHKLASLPLSHDSSAERFLANIPNPHNTSFWMEGSFPNVSNVYERPYVTSFTSASYLATASSGFGQTLTPDDLLRLTESIYTSMLISLDVMRFLDNAKSIDLTLPFSTRSRARLLLNQHFPLAPVSCHILSVRSLAFDNSADIVRVSAELHVKFPVDYNTTVPTTAAPSLPFPSRSSLALIVFILPPALLVLGAAVYLTISVARSSHPPPPPSQPPTQPSDPLLTPEPIAAAYFRAHPPQIYFPPIHETLSQYDTPSSIYSLPRPDPRPLRLYETPHYQIPRP